MPKHPTIVTLVNYQTPKNGILSNAIIIHLWHQAYGLNSIVIKKKIVFLIHTNVVGHH